LAGVIFVAMIISPFELLAQFSWAIVIAPRLRHNI
jgi:hypothetical protein